MACLSPVDFNVPRAKIRPAIAGDFPPAFFAA
jgi:hypothetical protein